MIAHGAMHAAFAGYTATAVGVVNTHMCLLPLELLAQAPRQARAGAEPAPLLQLCD
jgi:6-phosphofructokinase 1